MQAIIARQPGDASVLEFCEVAEPKPALDEIKIRVKAFGLNKAEAYNRMGNHGGFSGKWALGIEAAGEVVEDPTGTLPAGQKVVTAMGGMMFTRHGSYADYICVKQSNVIAVNNDIDFVSLATLPEAYLTAWGALDFNLKLNAGETLLIRGATSSVGMAAVTYAKHVGAKVIATTRQENRVERLKALGADHVIVDTGEIAGRVRDITLKGVDKAIELVGAVTVKDTLQAVKRWGEVAFVGFLGGTPVAEQFHFMNDLPNTVKLSFFGSGILGSEDLSLCAAPINQLASALLQGKLPSIHAKTFSRKDIQAAHQYLESNEAFGKIVVTVD